MVTRLAASAVVLFFAAVVVFASRQARRWRWPRKVALGTGLFFVAWAVLFAIGKAVSAMFPPPRHVTPSDEYVVAVWATATVCQLGATALLFLVFGWVFTALGEEKDAAAADHTPGL